MSLENLTNNEIEQKFEMFLFNMPDCLELLATKANTKSFNFDYSIKSLTAIEEYIKEFKITVNDNDYNDLSAYLGEVVRKNYGGKWICNLDKEYNSLYFGFPVIAGHTSLNVLLSPFHLIKSYILRPKENLFVNAIESQINPQEIDWSQFPEEK